MYNLYSNTKDLQCQNDLLVNEINELHQNKLQNTKAINKLWSSSNDLLSRLKQDIDKLLKQQLINKEQIEKWVNNNASTNQKHTWEEIIDKLNSYKSMQLKSLELINKRILDFQLEHNILAFRQKRITIVIQDTEDLHKQTMTKLTDQLNSKKQKLKKKNELSRLIEDKKRYTKEYTYASTTNIELTALHTPLKQRKTTIDDECENLERNIFNLTHEIQLTHPNAMSLVLAQQEKNLFKKLSQIKENVEAINKDIDQQKLANKEKSEQFNNEYQALSNQLTQLREQNMLAPQYEKLQEYVNTIKQQDKIINKKNKTIKKHKKKIKDLKSQNNNQNNQKNVTTRSIGYLVLTIIIPLFGAYGVYKMVYKITSLYKNTKIQQSIDLSNV